MAFFIFATFGRIEPIVPEFFRIGFRFERIPGRSAEFLRKWSFEIFAFFEYGIDRIDRIDRTYRAQSVSIVSIEVCLVRWYGDDDGPFGLEKTFFVIFGRTDLRINLSGAKFHEKPDFDI